MSGKQGDGQEGQQSGSRKADESFEVQEVEFDPTRQGYTKVPNYFAYYWTPLLGPKVALTYERLCSFAHGKKEDCHPCVGYLADILGIDRHDLTGRWRRDRREGRRSEYYQKGIFQVLAEHGLIRVEVEDGPEGRHYKFKVLKSPPLLTPEQLAELPPRLQRKHQELLDRCQQEREAFFPPAVSSPVQGCGGATGGCVAAPQGVCGGATGDLNNTNLTTQPKHSSLPGNEERERVQDFYKQIGQPRISHQKLKAGMQILVNLKEQGFSAEEIMFSLAWLLSHKHHFGGHIYSLGLLPQIIGQALQEREQGQKAAQREQRRIEEERKREDEQARRQELEALYCSLPPTEQAALREVAVENLLQSGMEKRFLLEPLIRGEICRLLCEERKISYTPIDP